MVGVEPRDLAVVSTADPVFPAAFVELEGETE
jgi:hypothetical protein